MGFARVPIEQKGAQPTKMRAGVGFISNVKPKNYNSETDETITTTELGGGSILQGLTLTSDVTYTLPTAALIVAENDFSIMDVGDAYTFYVANNQAAAFDVIIAVGVGITAIGTNNNLTVAPQSGKMFTLVKTDEATFDLY